MFLHKWRNEREFEGNSRKVFSFKGTCSESLPFISNLDNVRVLRRGQETTEPDPVTVVSDRTDKRWWCGGDEYKWNSTLDGIIWGWSNPVMDGLP